MCVYIDVYTYIYIYIYIMYFYVHPGGVVASHEQLCDFGIMGMWYSRVPQQTS